MDSALQPMLDALQAALIPPTRSAAQLPSSGDLSFERTLSRSLARTLDQQSLKILEIAQSLLDWTTSDGDKRVELDEDLIRDGEYSAVTVRCEHLLEHADDQLDRHAGTGKHRKSTGKGAAGAKSFDEMQEREKSRQQLERLPARLLHDSTLTKPQLSFTPRTKIEPHPLEDDRTDMPLWKPILSDKLHPVEPTSAEGWLQTEVYEPTSRFTPVTDTRPPAYSRYIHPYALELERLTAPDTLLDVPTEAPGPIPKDSFDKTPFEWVGDVAALNKMVQEIREIGSGDAGQKELAIDLEHHDFRSWSGFTCLIQLSTREKDYVIDAIDPQVRDSLEALNEFFTDPSWIKVLHGASSDIVWLQRDFGLYIVGLFDTYHATHVLGYSQHSLASLLDMYTDFEPDKRYQLADWRIRPLPKEMLHYARSDTHYLLAIYDHLRIALSNKIMSDTDGERATAKSALEEVFARSIRVSSTVFSLAPYDHETGHFDSGFLIPLSKSGQLKAYSTALAVPTFPIKTGWGPGEGRFEVLRSLMRWRENVARHEDESARYVMGIQGVCQVVEQSKRVALGGSAELVRVLGGTRGGVSDIVRKRKEELVQVIRDAIEAVDGDMAMATGAEDQDATMTLAGGPSAVPSFEPAVRPVEGLWDDKIERAAPVASTSTSTFFGGNGSASASASTPPPITVMATSSFFGPSPTKVTPRNRKASSTAQRNAAERKRIQAVQKVHESLVLGGGLARSLQPHSIPTPNVGKSSTPPSTSTAVDSSNAPVPLPLPDASFLSFDSSSAAGPKAIGSTSHAQSRDAETRTAKPKDSDVIVVSSLKDKPSRSAQAAQAKKRRRATTDVAEPAPVASTSTSTLSASAGSPPPQPPQAKKQKKKKSTTSGGGAAAVIAPHDYSGSTSILDAGPTILTGLERREAEKKQKKLDKAAAHTSGAKAGGGPKKIDTSEFKRPMRVNNAPKSASVSKTFAK